MDKLNAAQQALTLIYTSKGSVSDEDIDMTVQSYHLDSSQTDAFIFWLNQNDLAIVTSEINLDGINSDNAYYRTICQYPLLTEAQEKELAFKIKQGDKLAYDKMVKSNLRLVVSIASGYQNTSLPVSDLIQEGNIGLLKAVSRYEPDKGVRFAQYGKYWIVNAILRALNQSHVIRVPDKIGDRLYQMKKVIGQLETEDREVNAKNIAQLLKISEKEVIQLMQYHVDPISSDEPINAESDLTLMDIYVDVTKEKFSNEQLKEELEVVLNQLDKRDRDIISKRFGLQGETWTLEALGNTYGLSKQRIMQIEKQALNLMKEKGIALIDYLGEI